MTDTGCEGKSNGSVSGAADQYADGRAAKIWNAVIGDQGIRTDRYKNFMVKHLKDRGCHRILDIAAGTGVDSIMLLEAGFDVTSVDASGLMLKHAFEARWNRRKEPQFDKWVIQEANWVTLYDDIEPLLDGGFDAIFCLGSSFPHLLDTYGDQREQRQAFANFNRCIKPGGVLIIDHRNFDSITDNGTSPSISLYYTKNLKIKTSLLIVDGVKEKVTLDYRIFEGEANGNSDENTRKTIGTFTMSYYPHEVNKFKGMLYEAFGEDADIKTYADFKELKDVENPSIYIHVVQKPL